MTGYWVGATNGIWSTLSNWRQTLSGTTAVTSFPGATAGDIAYFFHSSVTTTRTVKISAAIPNALSLSLNSNAGVTITDNGTFIYNLILRDNGSVPAISTGTTTGTITITNTDGSSSVSATSNITLQPKNAAAVIDIQGDIDVTGDIYVGDIANGGTFGTVELAKTVGYFQRYISFSTLYLGRHTTDNPTLRLYGNTRGNLVIYRGTAVLDGNSYYIGGDNSFRGNVTSSASDPTTTPLHISKDSGIVIVNPPEFQVTNPDTGYGVFVPSPYTISVPVFVEVGVFATNVFPSSIYFQGGGIGILDSTGSWITGYPYSGTRGTVLVEDGYDAIIAFGEITTYFGPRTQGTPYKLIKANSPDRYPDATVPVHVGVTSIVCEGDNLFIKGDNVFTASSPVDLGFSGYSTCSIDLYGYTGDIYVNEFKSSYANSIQTIKTSQRNFYVTKACTLQTPIISSSTSTIFVNIPDVAGVPQYFRCTAASGLIYRVQQGGLSLNTGAGSSQTVYLEGEGVTRFDLANCTVSLNIVANSTSIIETTYADIVFPTSATLDGVITGYAPTFTLNKASTVISLKGQNTFYASTFYLNYGTLSLDAPQYTTSGPLGNISASFPPTIVFGKFGTLRDTIGNADYSPYFSNQSIFVRVDTFWKTISWASNISANGIQKFGEGTLRLAGDNRLRGLLDSTGYTDVIRPPFILYGGTVELGSDNAFGPRNNNPPPSFYSQYGYNDIVMSGKVLGLRSDSTTSRTIAKDFTCPAFTTFIYPNTVDLPITVYFGDAVKTGALIFNGSFTFLGSNLYTLSDVYSNGYFGRLPYADSYFTTLEKYGAATLHVAQMSQSTVVTVNEGVFRVTGLFWYVDPTKGKAKITVKTAAQFNCATPQGRLELSTLVMSRGATLRVSR